MIAYIIRRMVGGAAHRGDEHRHLRPVLRLPDQPRGLRLRQELLPRAEEGDRGRAWLRRRFIVQWGKFAKGFFVGRDYPDDPALKETAPETIVHCAAPCLGYSKERTSTVTDLIKDTLPVSMSIALVAFLFWIIGGVLLGRHRATQRGTIIDRGLVGLSLVLYAFPTFFIGLLLYKFVAIQWGWVDVPRYTTIEDGGVTGWLSSLLLPASRSPSSSWRPTSG